jgi:hypothetical protein
MNERIRELIKQATEHDYTTWDSYNQKELVYYKFNKEKFAELIVRECIQVVDNMADPEEDSDRYVWALHNASEKIREHFGVQE